MTSKFFKANYNTDTHRKCKIHGVLPIEGNFYALQGKNRHGKEITVYRCALCRRAYRTKRYHQDPEKDHANVSAWRHAHPQQQLADEVRLEAARAAWRAGFEARVQTVQAALGLSPAEDVPTPIAEGDE